MPRKIKDVVFLPLIQKMHKEAHTKMMEIEDFSFSWLDEILRETKKAFAKDDVHLLPKTPTAKAADKKTKRTGLCARKLIPAVEQTDDYVPPSSARLGKKNRNDEQSTKCKTRTTSKATASKAKPQTSKGSSKATRETSVTKQTSKAYTKTSKTTEPVCNLEKLVLESEPDDGHSDSPTDTSTSTSSVKSETSPSRPELGNQTAATETPQTNLKVTSEIPSTISSFDAKFVATPETAITDSTIFETPVTKSVSTPETSATISTPSFESPVTKSVATPETSVISPLSQCETPVTKKQVLTETPKTAKSVSPPETPWFTSEEWVQSADDTLLVIPSESDPDAEQAESSDALCASETCPKSDIRAASKEDISETQTVSDESTDQIDGRTECPANEMVEPRRSMQRRSSLKPSHRVSLKSLPSREKTVSQASQKSVPVKARPNSKISSGRANISSSKSNSSVRSRASQSSSSGEDSELPNRSLSKKRQRESSDEELNNSKRYRKKNSSSSGSDASSPQRTKGSRTLQKHPRSFVNSLKSGANPIRPANINTGLVKSFIAKNSPARLTVQAIQERKKKELMEKAKKNDERMKQREEENRKRMEEMKRLREERMKRVIEMRNQKQQQEKENKMMLERRLAEKRIHTSKLKEDKLQGEKEKQKMRLQKIGKAESRRKQEEAEKQKKLQEQLDLEDQHQQMFQKKREQEEKERQKRIEEEKQKMLERQQEVEREREKERQRLLKLEEEKEKERQRKINERNQQWAEEKARKERLQREREEEVNREVERLRQQAAMKMQQQLTGGKTDETNKENNQQGMIKPHMATGSVTDTNERKDSYEMTPTKPKAASTAENYNIHDLNSGDETDDDEAPRKRIPDWAQGSYFKTLLVKQIVNPPNLDSIFGPIAAPDLNILFARKKARFNKRTSSAHWDEPLLKPDNLRPY